MSFLLLISCGIWAFFANDAVAFFGISTPEKYEYYFLVILFAVPIFVGFFKNITLTTYSYIISSFISTYASVHFSGTYITLAFIFITAVFIFRIEDAIDAIKRKKSRTYWKKLDEIEREVYFRDLEILKQKMLKEGKEWSDSIMSKI